MTVSLVQTRGTRRAAGKVRHATSERTSRLAHELGYSKRQIALSIRMPKTTVGDYLARAAAAGLRYADVAGLSEEAVEALLFQRAELPEQRPMPDWEWVSAELGRRGVTLMLVWEEYRQQHRDGYSYVNQRRRHLFERRHARRSLVRGRGRICPWLEASAWPDQAATAP